MGTHRDSQSSRRRVKPAPVVRVYLYPRAEGEDAGEGGVGRVIRGQMEHLPRFGVELVDNPASADIIACHITIPVEFLRLYPEKAFVAHCHGLYWAEYRWAGRWHQTANTDVMEAIRVADAVTVPSEWVGTAVRRHTCRPAIVVPHGIDPAAWSAPAEHWKYVWWDKTRVDPVCDPVPVQQLANALPEFQFKSTFGTPTPNLEIVGQHEDPRRAPLTFAEAAEYTRNAGLYLATSRETFGVATLQALACGVPVVGYRWGGQAEIVEHMVDGYLARPNDIDDLAEGIRWAAANREAITDNCRRKAEQYPWERAAALYAKLYRELVERRTLRSIRPRTSVIVRAHNLEKYLPETLDSVLAQHDQSWECIVVDDASPDRCGEIAEEYAARDGRFRVIHNERNVYLSEAFNVGIREAVGRYILPLDADDMLPPAAMATLADALDQDRTAHVVYGNVRFVHEDGVTPEQFFSRGQPLEPGHSGWPMPFNWLWQVSEHNLLPYSSMFRREAWAFTGGYRRHCKTAEDADFWARISSYGFRPRMVTESDTLVYRSRPDSISRGLDPSGWSNWLPWRSEPLRSPAGACTDEQLPVPTLEPPAISVVIPVGPGHEGVVQDAVDSVEAQTLRHWECIVVNDSGHPLQELPFWVRQFDTGGGKGVAAARNLGISHAKALLYLPLDADDILEPHALMTFFEDYKRRPGTILYSDFYSDMDGWSIFRSDDWKAQLLLAKGAIATVTQLTPVAAWKDVGGYDESLSAWEDWAFQLSLAAKGYCSARIARPLFTYRHHTGRRAHAQYARRFEYKPEILDRFGDYWDDEGRPPRKTLMACGCSGAQTATIHPAPPRGPDGPGEAGMELIQYTGNRAAGVEYRGPSGQVYNFAAGTILYVKAQDVAHFLQFREFARYDGGAAAVEQAEPLLQSAQGASTIPVPA